MLESKGKLNIVDESGNIVGEDFRESIHEKGLLHQEIHVWFYTQKSEIIFQHRTKDKDTYPDLLDATVGGHVEIGMDYLQTALKETSEETGISLAQGDLVFLQTVRKKDQDSVTGKTNNAIRAIYLYRHDGEINELKPEKGKIIGFEAWPFERLLNLSEQEKKRFIPYIVNAELPLVLKEIIKYC